MTRTKAPERIHLSTSSGSMRQGASGAPAPMMVATKSFNAELDGERVTITAGRDRVAPGHELVVRFPHHFKLETTQRHQPHQRRPGQGVVPQRKPRRSTSALVVDSREPTWRLAPASTSTPSRGDEVDLRADNTAPSTVRFGALAYDAIIELARASEDGRETGGLLLGYRTFSWQPLEILEVTGPGPSAQRSSGEFKMDHAYDLAVEHAWMRQLDGHGANLGHWHTHPEASVGLPSEPDLGAWLGYGELLGVERYLGVIVTPHRNRGWGRPHLNAWILRP
jgi:hypothetical protein